MKSDWYRLSGNDTVCINQAVLFEQNRRAGRMADTYEPASKVIIRLRQSSPDITRTSQHIARRQHFPRGARSCMIGSSD